MLKMRLQRIGRRNSPAYRVLVVDSRQGPKSGKFIDQIGAYDPRTGDISFNKEKAKQWIDKGVKASGTVYNMLIEQNVIEGKKVNVLPKKSPIQREGAEEETTEASAPEADQEEEKSEEGDLETTETEEAAAEPEEETKTEEEAPAEETAEEAETKATA